MMRLFKHFKTFLIIISVMGLSFEAFSEGETMNYSPEVEGGYTLIGASALTLNGSLKCELAVLSDFENARIRLVRMEERKQLHSVDALRRAPTSYKDYGLNLNLEKIFPKAKLENIADVHALFRLKDPKNRTLKLVAAMKDGSRQYYSLVINDYYTDKPGHCLK